MRIDERNMESKPICGKCPKTIVTLVLTLLLTPVWAQDTKTMPGMDHSQMDHSQMDHASTPAAADGMSGSMEHGAMQGGSAPPDARDPHAYSDGLVFGPHRHMMHDDQSSFATLLVDRLEAVHNRDQTHGSYDLQFRYGRDYDKLVVKAEGEASGGRTEEARTELLWSHAVAAYWDTQLGARYDSGTGPERGWLAFGVQGLAPYWFETDVTAYVGDDSRSALRLSAEYELLLTQKLILQPRLEANFYGKQDAARELGAGLSDVTAGIRLRYEIRREFAPYVGVEWAGKYGSTADYAKASGVDIRETRVVAGLRFWY
jgi:copper resistance protein B